VETIIKTIAAVHMSELGQNRKCRRFDVTSALPHKADINCRDCQVRFVPIAAVPNVHSRKAPATWANPQVLLLKNWTVTGF
jgi:hypothetical protein